MSGGHKERKALPRLQYVQYSHEKEPLYLAAIRKLIAEELSEPYSIYVYRYFLGQWGDLCFLALDEEDRLLGVVICKLEPHLSCPLRGYIAMLVVLKERRGNGIATQLVKMAIDAMIAKDANEICLETEVVNVAATKLYERLGFLKTKQLHRYYLNGNSANRLLLPLKANVESNSSDETTSQDSLA